MSLIKLRWKNTFVGLSLLSFMPVHQIDNAGRLGEASVWKHENEVDRAYELFAKQNKSLHESV